MPENVAPKCPHGLDALKDLADERDRRYDVRFEALTKAVDVAFASAEKALGKAESQTEARLALLNEFRRQMGDERNTFATKEALQALVERVTRAEGQRAGGGDAWKVVATIGGLVLAGLALALGRV